MLHASRFARPLAPVPTGCRTALLARRTLFSRAESRTSHELDLNKLNDKRRDYERNRTAFLAAGAGAGIISFIFTAWKLKQAIQAEQKSGKAGLKMDSAAPAETFKTEAGEKRKIVLHDDEGKEIVPTGNSTVPFFPRVLEVAMASDQKDQPIAARITNTEGADFTLVGLGMRTVTFLGIQVYVVGFYVATQDIAKLQHYLVKKVNPLATTLIPSEKEQLRAMLKDATQGEEAWNDILKDAGVRSVFRIAPVRDTDFHHLRDGFVRAITARSKSNKAYNDDQFGEEMKKFKDIFNRGSVPKKKEMLLCRDVTGEMTITYSVVEGQRETMGTVTDERLSRLLWLNYLAGKQVASAGARDNIIEGIMEFVERPVGSVASQVI